MSEDEAECEMRAPPCCCSSVLDSLRTKLTGMRGLTLAWAEAVRDSVLGCASPKCMLLDCSNDCSEREKRASAAPMGCTSQPGADEESFAAKQACSDDVLPR